MNGKNRAIALLMLVGAAATAVAADWPQFRGAGASAVGTDRNLPVEWGADRNIAWKVKVPGYGWSSPVVWADRVFVTTAVAQTPEKPTGSGNWQNGTGRKLDTVYRWEIHCLGAADGKLLWKRTAAEGKPTIPINTSNTYASETPVTDGERVVAYFGMHGVFCWDLAGNLLWMKDLGSFPTENCHGTGASPVLDGRLLFIQCDNEQKSFLVALDVKTGEQRWRVERTERTGWSMPLVWKNRVRTELVCLGRQRVQGYDPATGKQFWELGGMNGQAMASPVADADLLFAGTGGQLGGDRPLFAVRAGASGNVTPKPGSASNESVAWSLPKAGPLVATPLLYEGHLYVLEQHLGMVTCHDAATGKLLYRERLPQARGFFASPWAYGGKVFCLDEDGRTFVLRAGAEFKLLGRNDVGEMCWASPALSGHGLFLRTVDHLYCIRTRQ
jgi:outer membrane protein assembly factor BamB